jgi:hypothetical protein
MNQGTMKLVQHVATKRFLQTRCITIPPVVTSWIDNQFVAVGESSNEGFYNLAPSRHTIDALCRVEVSLDRCVILVL